MVVKPANFLMVCAVAAFGLAASIALAFATAPGSAQASIETKAQRQQAALICEAVAKNAGTRARPPLGTTVEVRQNVGVNAAVNVGPQGVPMAAPPSAGDYRASQEAMESAGEGIGAAGAALFRCRSACQAGAHQFPRLHGRAGLYPRSMIAKPPCEP